MPPSASPPVLALLVGAALWGVVWYPYRLLAHAGLDGIWATLLTYGLAFVAGTVFFRKDLRALRGMPRLAWAMALAIGLSNLAYVVAVLEGEVLRILLLFYLAPLWTVPIAALVLRERLDGAGAAAMGLALAGAATMLWRPELGLPWPATRAEWLGVAAGFFFALGNVLVRRVETMGDAAKSLAIWLGVVLVAAACLPMSRLAPGEVAAAAASRASIVVGVGLALVSMSLALQYGLSRIPANRAIVILLAELPVAALAAWLLAGEVPRPQDWLGGALIVAGTLAVALRR
jgi:drug/metabolite transporter (DMT)-like permease